MACARTKWLVALVATTAAVLPGGAAYGAKRPSRDTVPPVVAIGTPAANAAVAGMVAVGGTASDAGGVTSVSLSVDGGAWSPATGTTSWSWSWSTAGIANGTHTLTARATDASGNTATSSAGVTVGDPVADTSPPSITVSAPLAGATVKATVTVAGSASDNVGVAAVSMAVDGGPWSPASGTSTWSWAWNTLTSANGAHTVTARAADVAGNTATSSVTVTVANPPTDTTPPTVSFSSPAPGATLYGTVALSGSASDDTSVAKVEVAVDGGGWSTASGTTSWSWLWATAGLPGGQHTLTARASDQAGNTTSTGVTVTLATAGPAPDTQGTWVSPEGATIVVSTAGSWTISQIYQMLRSVAAGPGDFARIAPTLTVDVQDTYPSQTSTSATGNGSVYTTYAATVWLKGTNSNFATMPDYTFGHEYGHAWAHYYLFLAYGGSWSSYLGTRWDTADGSVTLGQDSRLETSPQWSKSEIIAEDYRLLFGSTASISEKPTDGNIYIPDPRNQPGLADWLLTTWRAGA